MKTKISMKELKNERCFAVSYCGIQHLLTYENPIYYNCGVYGWNCDIYYVSELDVYITTGYRNMRGDSISYEMCRKYDDKARAILSDYTKGYEKTKKELHNLLIKMLKKVMEA